MVTQKISGHCRGRQEIAEQNRRPCQSVQNRFGENKGAGDKTKLKNDKEEHDAKTRARLPLRQRKQLGRNTSHNAEGQTMHPV